MSLIYCKSEEITRPYYVEALNVHIYSIQELSYVIYEYPLLVLDGFITEELLEFIEEELEMSFFASKLKKWLKSKENPDEILSQILCESYYYSTGEIKEFQQKILELRKLSSVEIRKERAALLCSLKQYAKAVKQYQEIVSNRKLVDAHVWANMGTCYARMLLTKEAFEAYKKAYELEKNPSILEKMAYLAHLDSDLIFSKKDITMEYENKIQNVKGQVIKSHMMLQIDALSQTEDAKKMITKWKQEYRRMVAST